MHGAGNDFIVLDGISQDLASISKDQWQQLAHRQLGIGADQILLVEKPTRNDAEFRYRIINADGSEVEQCGNGSRCFVKFVREKGLTKNTSVAVEVAHTVITLTENVDGQVTVDMGEPIFNHDQIPFDASGLDTKQDGGTDIFELPLTSQRIWVAVASMGNPHAVSVVKDVNEADVETLGPQVEKHVRFPNKVNAGFMQILAPNEIKLRVYERGSGETLACGTGACAAVVTGIQRQLLKAPVLVHTRGGDLTIDWNGQPSGHVLMTGPAQTVYEGEISLT